MDPTDEEIRRRLDALKKSSVPIPSENELHEKLQKLKGCPQPTVKTKYVLFTQTKTAEEQVNDLMKQFSEEVSLTPIETTSTDEIEQRLAKLKSDRDEKDKNMRKTAYQDDFQMDHSGQILPAPSFSTNIDENVESDEDYCFCYTCERRAKWICDTCDSVAFCVNCFEKFHKSFKKPHKKKMMKNFRYERSSSDSEFSD